MATDDKEVCPLCMEAMEADDLAFYPCDCRYQICRFCWAKIINEENGLCPACRKEYNSENPALYKPVSESDDGKLKCNRKRKEQLKKTKLTAEMLKLLPELRVVQPNLIFVVGLPPWICKDKEILKGPEYFGRYGKVYKVEINQNQMFGGSQGQPSFSAYITYCRSEDAMRSIRELDHGMIHGRPLRVSLGTTKYCSQFLRGAKCTKHECMYLHELGDPAASFTKEEMQAGKHTEYMNKLLVEYVSSTLGSAILVPAESAYDVAESGAIPLAAGDSSEDRNTRSSSALKDPTHPHPLIRGRHRLDTGNGGSHNQSHSGRSKRSSDGDYHRKNTAGDNSRRPRQHRGDHHLSSGASPIDRLPAVVATGKSNLWHSADYPDACDLKQGSSGRVENHIYVNGFDDPTEQDDSDRKTKDHKRGHPTSRDQGRRARKSSTDNPFPLVTNANYPDGSQAAQTNWRPGLLSPCESSGNLNDEPVDIGFDPFRESQQGLAELLAAEMGRLNVIEDSCMRIPNGQFPLLRTPLEPFRPQCTLSNHLSDPPGSQRRVGNFSWDTTGSSCSGSDNIVPTGDLFPNRVYPPPPGFEEGTASLRQTVNASSFFCISEPSHSDSAVLSGSPYSFVPMGINTTTTSNSNNNNAASSNGSLPDSAMFQSFAPHSGHTVEHKFGPSTFDFSTQLNGLLHSASDPSTLSPGSNNSQAPGSSALRPDPQQQMIANLFAAAFNTASAMLQNHVPMANDGKVGSSAPNKLSPPFDLNAFFSQLCRQSPLLWAALHTGSQPTPEQWTGPNGNSATSNNNTEPRSWDRAPDLIGDNSSSSGPFLCQSSRLPSKSMESDGCSYPSDGLTYTNCNLPPMLHNSDGLSYNTDSSGSKGSYSNSGGPGRVSGFNLPYDSSPSDLWQSTPTIRSTFDGHTPQTSYTAMQQPSTSGPTTNSAMPRPPPPPPPSALRDPSLHSSSQAPPSTE